MIPIRICALGAILLLPAIPLHAQDAAKTDTAKAAAAPPVPKDALTLENLFPKKGIFGPAPSGAEFARSGRYAAWLHVPSHRAVRPARLVDWRACRCSSAGPVSS